MSSGELLLLLLIQLYYMNVIRFLKSFRKTKGQFLISYMCERSICWWDGFGSNNQSITILFIIFFNYSLSIFVWEKVMIKLIFFKKKFFMKIFFTLFRWSVNFICHHRYNCYTLFTNLQIKMPIVDTQKLLGKINLQIW